MQKLILHSYRRCPFAIRVRMVLEEKGLAYELKEESLSKPSAELLSLSPDGKVPALVHNGKGIVESAIITEYLEDLFPEPILRPIDPLQCAQMRLWTLWCNTEFKVDLDRYKYQWEKLIESEKLELAKRLHAHLQKLNLALEGQAFLLGPNFSLADIHVFPFYRQLQKAKPDFHQNFHYPLIQEWLEKIMARPSFERVMKKVQ